MNFSNIPSKAEVMGWNPQTLADYMRKLKLSGCDRVVTKSSIDGAQFMNMTECDLQMFPCLFVPIITKIKTEINKEEHKKASSHKSKPLKYPKQDKVFVQEEDVWESDEFVRAAVRTMRAMIQSMRVQNMKQRITTAV